MHVQLHLQQALPVLEGEHRAPQIPEVGLEKALAEILFDRDVVQVFLALEQQLDDLPLMRLAQTQRSEIADLTLLVHQSGLGPVGIVVVDPTVLVEHAVARRQLQCRHILEQIPEVVVIPVHLAAAAHDVAVFGIARAIERATGHAQGVEDGDVLPLHASIADQIKSGREPGNAAAYDPCLAVRHLCSRDRTVAHIRAHHVRWWQAIFRALAPEALADICLHAYGGRLLTGSVGVCTIHGLAFHGCHGW